MQDFKALIIDSDIKAFELLKISLCKESFECLYANNTDKVLKQLTENQPDLIILSLDMPDFLGNVILCKIRRVSNIPLIAVSQNCAPINKINALNDGADEYLVKPFEAEELLAYIKALLRRSLNMPVINFFNDFDENGLYISIKKFEMKINGEKIEMPPKEIELAHYLATQKGRVVSRKRLFNKIWGDGCKSGERTVDVHIKHLRDKLKGNWRIKTVHGAGYKLEFEE